MLAITCIVSGVIFIIVTRDAATDGIHDESNCAPLLGCQGDHDRWYHH